MLSGLTLCDRLEAVRATSSARSPSLSENRLVLNLSHNSRLWFLLGAVSLSPLFADENWRDPEFEKVPFAEWLSGAQQTPLKWTEHVLPVVLSIHQRLLARMQIQLDGAEAARRRGEGELIFYFQLTDASGRIYQDHTSYDLEKVEEGLKAQDLVCTESAFVMPGDYSVSLAIYDTATKEHSVKKDKLHVAPLKTETLPDAWHGLPPVEFIEASEPPDHWFLPKERGRLHLPLSPRRPLQIEVVVNLTPSELAGRAYGVQDRNLSFIFPALKVISEMNAPSAPINLSLLDLARRKIPYHQERVAELDWEAIKASMSNATSGSIDVKSLSDRQHNAAFFVKEIAGKITAPTGEPGRVVIVLSSPMVFDAEQDLQGIDLKLPPGSRVFYIRLQSARPARPVPGLGPRGGRGIGGFPGRRRTPEESETFSGAHQDQLEPMLKPLDPRLFDVTTAEQFRKALATIMTEISGF